MKNYKFIFVSFFVLLPFLLSSQGAASGKRFIAKPLQERIKIDGVLSEKAWQEAEAGSDFIEYEPRKGQPSQERTEFRVVFDQEAVYFGIACHDAEPDKLIARLSNRDSDLSADDSVQVALDTFLDRQSAYFFYTNILGAQADGRVSGNGATFDSNWDTVWQAAAVKTAFGWTAEIAIPFASIKYKAGENRTWGLGVVRYSPRRLAKDCWSGNMEFLQRVSQYGELAGLNLPQPQKRHAIIPHVIVKMEKHDKTKVEAGLDARYAFSQSTSLNLTVNPDFATIEADQEQINLTRFELGLPEKRNFFQEGSDIYSQRIQLFYSRRIADIYGGLKFYGKNNEFEISGLSAQGRPDPEKGEDSSNFSVFRFKKSIMKSSSIGILAANKLSGGRSFGDAGIDANLNLSEKLNFTGQLAFSYGDYSRQNVAFYLRPSFDSATSHFHIRYSQLGERFADNANRVGFIADDDRRELDSALEKTWWLKKTPLERIQYFSNYNIYWGMNAKLRSWEIRQGVEVDLRNKFTLEFRNIQEFKSYEKGFRNWQTTFEIGYNRREWQSLGAAYEFGRNFDADFTMFDLAVKRKLGTNLSLEYSLTRFTMVPDPKEESTWLHILRLHYFFNNDFFLKVFYQLNSAIEKKNIQIVLVWRFQPPFGLLQLAYQQGSVHFGDLGGQEPTLFIKLAYVF